MVSYKHIVMVFFLLCMSGITVSAADDAFSTAGNLYTKSVDLANEGNYKEALATADQALALNVTSLVPIIQANRAGILVMLGRYDEAIAAADAALAVQGNLTTTHSIAYYNKGNALHHLGKIEEARAAFTQAHDLDNTLVIPDITPTPTRAPLPAGVVITACAAAGLLCIQSMRKPDRPD